MSIQLSVNVNKVATIRNSRGGAVPSVVAAVETCLAAGAPGITVHPREDARHIRPADVTDIAATLARHRARGGRVEYN
ncbi:MAG: pyridoxine 5'-phosphate synthase, partial [Vicinamibacterales bacterium]